MEESTTDPVRDEKWSFTQRQRGIILGVATRMLIVPVSTPPITPYHSPYFYTGRVFVCFRFSIFWRLLTSLVDYLSFDNSGGTLGSKIPHGRPLRSYLLGRLLAPNRLSHSSTTNPNNPTQQRLRRRDGHCTSPSLFSPSSRVSRFISLYAGSVSVLIPGLMVGLRRLLRTHDDGAGSRKSRSSRLGPACGDEFSSSQFLIFIYICDMRCCTVLLGLYFALHLCCMGGLWIGLGWDGMPRAGLGS